jgi:phosphoribosylaminoimidazole carboxylase PurE protein
MMNQVAVILGSKSDLKFWEESKKYLDYFGITSDLKVLSAHRTPDEVADFSNEARKNGIKVIIAGAGMAAHLAGAIAANTDLPVLGVPLPGGVLDGMDALLSTVQMPTGVPVATFAVGTAGFRNACVFAAQILSLTDSDVLFKLKTFKKMGAKL